MRIGASSLERRAPRTGRRRRPRSRHACRGPASLLLLLMRRAARSRSCAADRLEPREPLGGRRGDAPGRARSRSGSSGVTGASEPTPTSTPRSSIVRNGFIVTARSGPSADLVETVRPVPSSGRTWAAPTPRSPAWRRARSGTSDGHLEVLHPVASRAEVPPLAGVERLIDALPGTQHLLDAAVADRVHPHLQAGGVPARGRTPPTRRPRSRVCRPRRRRRRA